MTEQIIIDLGDSPDDGTGDTLYEAFSKVNANFGYLFGTQGEIPNSVVLLEPTQAEITAGRTEFGLQVLFPSTDQVDLFYDTSLSWLDPTTGTATLGAFKFQKNDNLVGIFTNSISTYGDQNLNLLSKGTGIATVTGTINYEQQIFHYSFGTIDTDQILAPKDPDALVNAQAMIDFVTAYHNSDYLEQIVSIDNPGTRVIAESDAVDMVQILVNGETVAVFTETESQLGKVLVTDQITSEVDQDLVLNPSLNVSVSGKRITNVADPIDPQDAVNRGYVDKTALGSIIGIDLTTAPDGALLIYNAGTQLFEASKILIKQDVDAGIY